MKVNEDLIISLKKDIFYRAKLFIDDMGEFAPFGSELIDEEIKPVMIYDDSNEIIEGVKLINVLKDEFSNKLHNNSIQAGAIAYDVFINVKTIKRNALCLIISVDGDNWTEDYYPYKVINNECVWG
ncbi:hypothetical protein [Flavobacterium sp.]|uniref:hypothetical protein n=1 Tax=Flavobacterium sp. TaxID=239 RepID=UPI003D6BA2B0